MNILLIIAIVCSLLLIAFLFLQVVSLEVEVNRLKRQQESPQKMSQLLQDLDKRSKND